MDDVLELTEVAGPVVTAEAFAGGGGEVLRLPLGRVELGEEMVGQRLDVVSAFPEGRQRDGKDVQAVEEVLPQLPRGHGLLETPVGGGDDARPRDRLVGAPAEDVGRLQDAEGLPAAPPASP
jgi:hypothetical protein